MAAQGSNTFPAKTLTHHVNIVGNMGRNYITPRGLKAHYIGQLVKVQGIVTRMSIVQQKLRKSYHYCEATKQGTVKEYHDEYQIDPNQLESLGSNVFPVKDAANHALSPDYGYMNYEDSQRIVIQELPEYAPPGQLPRSVVVHLNSGLCDTVKPGD